MALWLGLWAFSAVVWVQSLVRELRSHHASFTAQLTKTDKEMCAVVMCFKFFILFVYLLLGM